MRRLLACPVALTLLAACSDETTPDIAPTPDASADVLADAGDVGTDTDPGPACTPDSAGWDAGVGALFAAHCGSCHGQELLYGAPLRLTELADFGVFSSTSVAERAAIRMRDGSMPPPWAPSVPSADLAAMIGWATCDPDAPAPDTTPLVVSAPPLVAPPAPPAGAVTIDFKAPEWNVAPDALNLYQCFTFEAPNEADVFIRRLGFLLDEAAVIHHIVLLRDPEQDAPLEPHLCYGMPRGSQYVYAWAPGGADVQFPEGGLRMQPGERFVLQIHYHNGAGLPDVFDSSGVRLWVTPPAGPEYGMVAIGPLGFQIPARSEADAVGTCAITEPSELFASFPHMHVAGTEFEQTLRRADGTEEPVISLTGWSFDVQRAYHTPVRLEVGDELTTRCRFVNDTDADITSGEDTEEEMCFNFAYITPPPANRYCDVAGDEEPLDYAPGECAPDAPELDPPTARATASVGTAPRGPGVRPAPGRYLLTASTFHFSTGQIIGQDVDFERSYVLARGQLELGETTMAYDVQSRFVAYFENGTSLDSERAFTFGGDIASYDAGTLTIARDCPSPGETVVWVEQTDEGVVFIGSSTEAGVTIEARYVLTPVE